MRARIDNASTKVRYRPECIHDLSKICQMCFFLIYCAGSERSTARPNIKDGASSVFAFWVSNKDGINTRR